MKLELDNQGIVVPRKPKLFVTRPVVNTRASNDLFQVDRVMSGEQLRIAVIRSSGGIGDVLMTFPTVKAIKQKYNCQLWYVTDYGYLDGALPKVAAHNPFIDKIVDFAHFKESDVDISINLTCPCVAHEVPKAIPVHRIDLFAGYCGIKLEDRKIDYIVTDEEKSWGLEFFQSRGFNPSDCIMVQPYASNSRRSLDINKLKTAIARISTILPQVKFLVIQHGSDFDKDTNWNLFKCLPVKNFDTTNIAALMYHCGLVLCPDSSLLHLAGALEKKIVAFFGPTDYRARMYPNMIPICPAEKFAYWPCWYQEVPPGAARMSWDAIEPEMIVQAVVEQMTIAIPKQYTTSLFSSESI